MIGLIILFSVVAMAFIWGAYLHYRETKEDHAKEIQEYENFLDLLRDHHAKEVKRLRDEYEALEKGRDDETECYQQDMLDLQEHIAVLQGMIAAFINSPVGTNPREAFKNYTP